MEPNDADREPARPRWPDRLLNWLVAPHLREEVLGDLHERYARRVQRLGEAQARRTYWREVLAYLRLSVIKRQPEEYPQPSFLSPTMLRNYFKITFRNLAKQKGLTLINVLSLSIGLACFSLFLLYAVNELTYDRFHAKADSIYRVYRWTEAMENQEAEGDSYLPMPLGPALKQELPDVEAYVRWRRDQNQFVRVNGVVSRLAVTFADPQVFEVFTLPVLAGNPKTALSDPRGLVVTEKVARQLFGETNPVGKILEIKSGKTFEPFTVTAVAKDLPENTNLQFGILGSYDYYASTPRGARNRDEWRRSSYPTYVLLRPDSKLADEPGRLLKFRQKHYPGEEKELRQAGYWKGAGAPVTYRLQPIKAIHTDPSVGGEVATINPKIIWILLGIAACILLIACINFTTLAIGRSAGRAKEVGVRKVIGGKRQQLVYQFLTESMLLTGFSALLGAGLCYQLVSVFNRLFDRELTFSLSAYPQLAWLLAGLVLLVGVVAGSYPALVLSGFQPVEVLKSKIRLGGANLFTKSLVTFQFVLSAGLMASTFIILQQLRYLRTHNPGFEKENIVVVDADGVDNTKQAVERFKRRLAQNPAVVGVTSSDAGLGGGMGWSRSGFDYQEQHKDVYEYFVDPDYINVLGMKLIAGRHFDARIASDTVNSVIINEAMVRDFGWTLENAVGQQLKGYAENLTPVVIGVVKDFHFRSFAESVKPQLFHQFSSYAPYKFFVRMRPGDPAPVLADLQATWKSTVSELPFKYSFLDDDLNRFYQSEGRWSQIVGWAGGISIFLACLGLFGLAALAASNRVKELGIRKVLGASVANLTALLAKDFILLVLIALALATPLAWYFMSQWLQGFASRIDIEWWVFVLTGLVAVGIALLTVSFQSIKAALVNPVKSLRSE